MKPQRGLEFAAGYARRSVMRYRVGACAEGFLGACNRGSTHPKLRTYGYPIHANIHAELAMVLRNSGGFAGATVYVARLTKDGRWALAKPCKCCMAVLADMGVKRVVWTTGPGSFEEVRL